jgi:hypothetical protein
MASRICSPGWFELLGSNYLPVFTSHVLALLVYSTAPNFLFLFLTQELTSEVWTLEGQTPSTIFLGCDKLELLGILHYWSMLFTFILLIWGLLTDSVRRWQVIHKHFKTAQFYENEHKKHLNGKENEMFPTIRKKCH